jgi:hypothetical protein
MTRRGADLSALSPEEAEIVRVFAAALRQIHEQELEERRFVLHEFEALRDAIVALNRGLHEVATQWEPKITAAAMKPAPGHGRLR